MTAPDLGPDWSASLARAPEATLRDWLAFAREACDEADTIALRHFRRDLGLARKPDRTYVTIADQGIERALRERIRARYPDHGLVGEEYGTDEGGAATRWVIDPIDATHNFIRGIPVFATLLAVQHEGEVQAAVISAPALRTRWWAHRGGGAWTMGPDLEERRIRASGIRAIEDAQVLYGSARETAASGLMPGFDRLVTDAWRERGFGDFWGYALVAEGAAEAMIETGANPWDMAAPTVIVEEAGGRLTDVDGHRGIVAASFVASNGVLHEELLQRLRAAT
jgi:histidinol-phosphatase